MEKGFYHPTCGYWQTNSEPPKHILNGYPEGTVEVPLRPSGEHQWQDGVWVHVPPDPDEVLAEWRANTRIPRAKFAIAAFKSDLITEQEMEDWAGGTAIPEWVADTIDGSIEAGHIPEEHRPEVRIAVLTQGTIGRMDRLIPLLAESAKLSPDQVDALFGVEV